VSLHRAEGFGLTLAEHMALGKPAIATAYSGNLDFMTEDVSRLVPARVVSIDRDYGPYLRGYRWAEPDLDAAARFIRELALAPDHARELGARGAEHVRRVLSRDTAARAMRERLETILAGRGGAA
jgi:glycosyltransferase involved in cell wall biosynthesis